MNLELQNSLKISLYSLLIFLFLFNSPIFSQEKFRKSPPYPDPLPELRLPSIESTVLSNGLGLSVVHITNRPVINLRLIILTGENSSPDNLPGLATFTAKMLSKGTLTLSSSKIEETIESIGGNFSSVTYPDYSIFSLSFLDEYLDEALNVLSKMILHPTFTRREIDNVQRSMFYEIVRKSSEPEFIAKRLLFKNLFKENSYRKIAFNREDIKNLNRKDLIAFFNKYYRPNNSKLVLTGNLDLSTASRKVSAYLNTWEKKSLEYLPTTHPEPNKKIKICFIDVPNAKDATILLGNSICSITNNDFFPLLVLNQVLGGTPNSRLFMNLRESKGYAYWSFSSVEFFKHCGVFYVMARIRPEVIYFSLMETFNEIKKITKNKIPNYELEQAKSYLIGNFPLQIRTYDNFSLKVSEIIAFNLGEKHWNKYYENIMLINSDKVFETAQKYLFSSPVVVIVGDINIVANHLKEFEIEVYNTIGIFQYIIRKGVEK